METFTWNSIFPILTRHVEWDCIGQGRGYCRIFPCWSQDLWRPRYDAERNLIVINNSHRDFICASRTRSLKLRYISRLVAKEIVYRNFPGTGSREAPVTPD
ncbi:MAG: hypothetical protein HY645_11055 [Acidobacteria bacterium]|nr:hypothetical protein [Acidobacteriota bacterium]